MKKKTVSKKESSIQGTGVRTKSTPRKRQAETSGVASKRPGPPHRAARQKKTAPAAVQWHGGVIVARVGRAGHRFSEDQVVGEPDGFEPEFLAETSHVQPLASVHLRQADSELHPSPDPWTWPPKVEW